MLSSLKACLIIARFFVKGFPRFAQNVMLLLCRVHREISSGQILLSTGYVMCYNMGVPKVMVGFKMITLFEWNTTDT
jgi:hypothetical protein